MSVQRSPPSSRSTSPNPSFGGPDEDQIETRSSRRIRGLPPEHGLLPPTTKPKTTMANQAQTPAASAVVYLPIAPRTPTPFHGDVHEDVEDWLQQYERVARHNGWTTEQCLHNLYFALEGTARHRFENHEASFTTWESRAAELKRTFLNHHRRQRAEDLLQTRVQGPNESVTSFVEDAMRLCARADPEVADEKKLRVLMRGVKAEIFGGLVRHPPTTVDGFVAEATNIERALSARASHYHRLAGVPAPRTAASCQLDLNATGVDGLREIVRDIVREELRKLLPAANQPAELSIAEVVREEVQRAIQPEAPACVAPPEESALTYAAVARRPPPPPPAYVAPPRRRSPAPQHDHRRDDQVQYAAQEPRAPRKTDVWRTPDRRLLCFHCGEANHTYRRCPYRRLGLRGFHPNDPRPRYGERPREIDEYLRRPQSPEPASRREFRSPSPR
ncbi:uncharacterized protein ISCGN_005944, partial [Ixodes scapularis]